MSRSKWLATMAGSNGHDANGFDYRQREHVRAKEDAETLELLRAVADLLVKQNQVVLEIASQQAKLVEEIFALKNGDPSL